MTLEKILKFITGQSSIPLRGLKNSIKIAYTRDEAPIAKCYFSIITVPAAYPGFANSIPTAISP